MPFSDPNAPLSERFSNRLHAALDRAGEIWMTIIAPFEWLVARFIDLVFSISEWFEAIDSLFAGISRLIRGTVSRLAALLIWIVRLVVPRPHRAAAASLASFVAKQSHLVHEGADWFIQVLNLDRFVGWIIWLLKPLWLPIATILGFFHAWFVTRAWKKLFWAIPALVLILPVLIVGGRVFVSGTKGLATPYRLALQQSLDARDYEKAAIYERKLAQLNVDTRLTDYQRADDLAREGNLPEAYARMQRLAPEDAPGYPAAHGWILQKLMGEELDLPVEESERLVELHLKHLDTLGFRGDQFNLIRATLHIRREQLAEADKLLETIARTSPAAAMERLRIHLKLKDLPAARQDARMIRSLMHARLERGEGLSSTQYSWWTAAEELLGDEKRLASVLEKWLANTPDNPQARKMLASIKRDEYLALLKTSVANPAEVARLLTATLEVDDDPRWLDQNVHELMQMQSSQPLAKEVLQLLAGAPQTPISVLEKLGSHAAFSGDLETAEACFQRALQREPDAVQSAGIWNNLAWTLWKKALAEGGQSNQLEQALKAANHAIELRGDEFRYRETRGQILVSLEKWQDAVADLEYALNGMPERVEIHAALATAYDSLGNDELAQLHRQHTKRFEF